MKKIDWLSRWCIWFYGKDLHPSIYPSIHPNTVSIYLSKHILSIHASITPKLPSSTPHSSIHPFTHPTNCLFIHQSNDPSVPPSTHPSNQPFIRATVPRTVHPSITFIQSSLPSTIHLYFYHQNEAVMKALDYYDSCLDEDKIEELDAKPLEALIKRFGSWNVTDPTWDENAWNFMDVFVNIHKNLSLSPLYNMYVGTDPKNSTQHVIKVGWERCFVSLTLSLPRVIKFKFPLQPHQ